jgi:hypothetical protein
VRKEQMRIILPDDFARHAPPAAALSTTLEAGWSVHVTHVEEGGLFGALHVEAPRRFRYIAVTLEYQYRGTGQTVLYPDTVALAHIGSSPLQGLTRAPLLFFNEITSEVRPLGEEPIAIPVEADILQRATFVYEFHRGCQEFRLYFPGCEGILISLATTTTAPS